MTRKYSAALQHILEDLSFPDGPGSGDGPGAAAAIMVADEVVGLQTVGFVHPPNGIAWTQRSRARIASLSKPMAAQTILSLCDEGALHLDMRAGDWLALADAPARATLRDMLGMRAGLVDEFAVAFLATGGLVPDHHTAAHKVRLVGAVDRLNHAPNARTLYSNSGYTLAQRMAEIATGRSFAELLAEHVFAPAGMVDAVFGRDATPISAGMGLGSRVSPDGYEAVDSWAEPTAAGGVAASLTDLIAWTRWNRRDAAGLWRRVCEARGHADGTPSGYALGVERKSLSGLLTLGHAGGLTGWASDYITLPERDAAVMVLANRTDVNWYERVREAACLAFGIEPDVTLTPRLARPEAQEPLWTVDYGDPIAGHTWRLGGVRDELRLEGRRLPRRPSGDYARALAPEPLVIEGAGDCLEPPAEVLICDGNVRSRYLRADTAGADAGRLVGLYRAVDLPGRIAITQIDGVVRFAMGHEWPAAPVMRVVPTFANLWRVFTAEGEPFDVHLFWPDLDLDPDRLEVTMTRLLRHPFRRVGDEAAARASMRWTIPSSEGALP